MIEIQTKKKIQKVRLKATDTKNFGENMERGKLKIKKAKFSIAIN
jgi:hypothetical protein